MPLWTYPHTPILCIQVVSVIQKQAQMSDPVQSKLSLTAEVIPPAFKSQRLTLTYSLCCARHSPHAFPYIN